MKLRTPPLSIEILEARIAPAFGAVFDLSSLDGTNGVALDGVAGSAASQRATAPANLSARRRREWRRLR